MTYKIDSAGYTFIAWVINNNAFEKESVTPEPKMVLLAQQIAEFFKARDEEFNSKKFLEIALS